MIVSLFTCTCVPATANMMYTSIFSLNYSNAEGAINTDVNKTTFADRIRAGFNEIDNLLTFICNQSAGTPDDPSYITFLDDILVKTIGDNVRAMSYKIIVL